MIFADISENRTILAENYENCENNTIFDENSKKRTIFAENCENNTIFE
ncbi:hypothetical protein T06_11972 [Trichinella sp. T6]|nr:hypothetical protein T06_11972 [Trichinella sp. T6]